MGRLKGAPNPEVATRDENLPPDGLEIVEKTGFEEYYLEPPAFEARGGGKDDAAREAAIREAAERAARVERERIERAAREAADRQDADNYRRDQAAPY